MRFLLGLITGAVMTLFVATATDAPTNPLVGKLSELWSALIHTTGQTLFVQPARQQESQRETPPTRVSAQAPGAAGPTPTAEPPAQAAPATRRQRQPAHQAPAPAAAAAPARDAKPISIGLPAGLADRIAELSALPAPAALSATSTPPTQARQSPPPAVGYLEQPPSAPGEHLTEAPGEGPLRTSAPHIPQDASSQLSGIGTEFATTTTIETPTETASVWTPFHSEVSARGFARQLSRQLDYPFAVLREGPGAYQVVFRYESTTQRDLVLSQLAALTSR